MFLCICAGQAVLVKCHCVKATRPREIPQLTISPDPGFMAGQWRAPGNCQPFCLARSGNHGLNECQAPECQWHTAQIKLLRALGAGVAWNMPYGWVQGQASRADCQNVESGDPRAQFPRAVHCAQRREHTLHHLPALWALAFIIVSASLKVTGCHLTRFRGLPTGNFQPWCGLVASIFC